MAKEKTAVMANEFGEGSILFPKDMIIFGENPTSIGLFALEFSKKGYQINMVNCKPRSLNKNLEYTVDVGSESNLFRIDDKIDLKDEDKLAQKTQSSGLVVVAAPLRDYAKIGNALGKALYNGYCRIDKHERHFLNILCTKGDRPASILREKIYETWEGLPNGHYLSRLGVLKFRITNAIANRDCKEKAGKIIASPDWNLLIEREIYTKMMKKFGEYRILSTEKEVKKAEKEGCLSKHEQFLGQIAMPQIKYLDNIQYDAHFKK